MRFRNFLPLTIFVVLTLPSGLGFVFIWEGYPGVLLGAQFAMLPVLILVYRTSINSAKKNPGAPANPGKIIYLPLKVNLFFYLAAGVPVVWIYASNSTVLMIAYAAGLAGFAMACVSGLTYIARSTKP
jgi:polyferredoxin